MRWLLMGGLLNLALHKGVGGVPTRQGPEFQLNIIHYLAYRQDN